MIVADTSAVVAALVGRPRVPGLSERLAEDGDIHAPHLIDVEVLQTLRRLEAAGELSPDRAHDARSDYADLVIVRYPHPPLADRMWELRHNLTAYDAAFVALSEILGTPLVTCDAGIAGAPGHRADIELFRPS